MRRRSNLADGDILPEAAESTIRAAETSSVGVW
jgi:hypothetical protein